MSPTNSNNTVAVLRHVLNVAIEVGVIYSNPAVILKQTRVRDKEIALPSVDKFNAMCLPFGNARRRSIERAKRSEQIASPIMTRGICWQRDAAKVA